MINIFRIYDDQRITDVNTAGLRSYTIGFAENNDYRWDNPSRESGSISFFLENGEWMAFKSYRDAKETFYVNSDDLLIPGDNVKQSVRFLSIDPILNIKASFADGVIYIGRDNRNTISISGSRVSRHHARIELDGETCVLTDTSSNGTYVNGKKIQGCIINPGDIISIDSYYFTFDGHRIVSCIPEFLTNDLKHVATSTRPTYKRSPRLYPATGDEAFKIQPPPGIGSNPEFYWSLSPIGMAASGIRFVSRKIKYNKTHKLLLAKYNEYLDEMIRDMNDYINKKRDALETIYPETQKCIEIAMQRSIRLWERSPIDADFMSLRVGIGQVPSNIKIEAPGGQLSLKEDPLVEAAKQLAEERKYIDNTPVFCDVAHGNTVGVHGNHDQVRALIKNMIVQAAVLHSYDELKICIFYSEREANEWAWCRWLPHVLDSEFNHRFMSSTQSETKKLANHLNELLDQRKQQLSDNSQSTVLYSPFYLFIVTDPTLLSQTPLLKHLYENGEQMQIGVIFLSRDIRQLPMECRTIIEVSQTGAEIFDRRDSLNRQPFTMDALDRASYERFSRNLAPLRLDSSLVAENRLPTAVTFLEGYGVKRAMQLNVAENWSRHDAHHSMAVPVGIQENGDPFFFDILSGHHGPHGLIVGTTGSGKTEVIQSWILSMAVRFSPQDVSFVLVDFKGTAFLDPFLDKDNGAKLPHIAGTISNLDSGIERNLAAMESELRRREELFSQYGVKKIAEYNQIAHEPLPFLFVIFDEFLDFKNTYSEYMPTIAKFFAQGRSLGMSFILMSQTPDPLSAFMANSEFKWCLRVKQPEDSRTMLNTSDAFAALPPGRFFITAQNGEVYQQVQSFFAGAPYRPYAKNPYMRVAPISVVNIAGRRLQYEDNATTGFKATKNEIDAVVEYLDKFARDNGIPRAAQIWTKELPDRLSLDTLISCSFEGGKWPKKNDGLMPAIGLIDDPQKQSQYPLLLDLGETGHAAVFGAPGSGKTTLLQTLVMSLALSYSPEDVHIYIMDFGGWSMNVFASLPHIGGIALSDDAEKINKLAETLADEIAKRKKKFASIGVTNIHDYQEVTGEKIPYIVLILDNFTAVFSMYPSLDKFFLDLVSSGANFGVLFMVSAYSTSALTFKIAEKIRTKLALHMTDKSSYTDLVGKTNGLIPADKPGRGLVKLEGYVAEFQTAMPGGGSKASEVIIGIRNLCASMSDAWTGQRPAPIPVMPDIIPFGSVSAHGITIGLQNQSLQPIGLDFALKHCLLISGTSYSGKSSLLKVICKQFRAGGAQIVLFDSPRGGLKALTDIAAVRCSEGEEMDEYIASLIPELQRRKELHDNNSAESFDELVIAVDDLKTSFDAISNQTAKRLEMIVKIGEGLNLYLLVAGSNKEISQLYSMGEGLTASLVSFGNCILLGGTFNEHSIFRANLSYSQKNEPLGEFEGYVVADDTATRFKAMNEV